ncbi:transmembrane/coiled-coil protein (DUF726) isoform X2 [Tasmannia lanceolata]|uniref:transmembrane/coiled-coil protein (DUF726) isoform X2 n=1 Tax=Tasmannia lanceolata TaxID=3420 RepID=UPI0040635917
MAKISVLTPTQKYAAGALLALGLRQAQIHQTHPLGSNFPLEEPETEDGNDNDDGSGSGSGSGRGSGVSSASVEDFTSDDAHLWTHPRCGLLRPVFRFLEIDSKAWRGLEETALLVPAKHHIGAFLRILSEETDESSSERMDQELALAKGVDAMAMSLEFTTVSPKESEEKHHDNEPESHQKTSTSEMQSVSEVGVVQSETFQVTNSTTQSNLECDEKSVLDGMQFTYQRKVAVLFELLSACLADAPKDDKKSSKSSRLRKGYDARHRVSLRLLATWLDIKWIKMEAMEVMVACSAMAVAKEEAGAEETESTKSTWSNWKRGGIIGAAALTGGTLLAITGGLAAPAIAAGFSALAPTLGTLVPVIGASGFAAVATAAGSVAGSVAVAASFGAAGAGLSGTKMARRIGGIDEFEFIAIGENHNQGRLAVGISVSGLVFEEEDFVRPWEGQESNLERYALQWESKNLMAVSNAIRDWLTSKITMELMKQGAMMTVLSSLLAALAWPATLLAATDFIDSKWAIAVDRSDKAGQLLAEVLLKGLQGNRPVTLVGFSLGARVIFKCLQHLAETGDNGIVERVVLLGAPISVKDELWETARKMVAGRFVNAYSTSDWTLAVAFRASLLTQGLAGIQPVDVPGIENVDVTELIEGHSSYLWTTRQILEQLELDTYYPVFSSSRPKPQ